MSTNVNLEAALGVMSFLATCFVLFIAGAVFAHALWTGKRVRARLALTAVFGLLMIYLTITLAFSFMSSERMPARAEQQVFEKRFSLNRERLRRYALLVRPQAIVGSLSRHSQRLLESFKRGAHQASTASGL